MIAGMDEKTQIRLPGIGAVSKKRLLYGLCFAALLCAYFWIAWRVPYTHDDWDWGLPIGLERWLTGELNNRYVGTFFVLLMTRSQWFKTLVMGGCISLVPHLAARLVCADHDRRPFLELMGHGLMLAIPIMTWRHTYGWVSAFANFVVGSAWMLLILTLLQKTAAGQRRWAIPLFPLCLAGQLFAENISVFMVLVTAAAAGYALKHRQGRTGALLALAGALAGAVLMFHNPLYSDLIQKGWAVTGIRNLVFPVDAEIGEIVLIVFQRVFTLVLPGLVDSHPVLWGAIALACLIRCARRKVSWLLLAPAGIFSAAYLWVTWRDVMSQINGAPDYPLTPQRTAGALVLLVLIITAICTDKEVRWPGLILLGGALFLVAPFAVVAEYGARCCYTSLVWLLLLALLLARDIPFSLWHKIGIGLLCLGVLAYHLYVYDIIGRCEALRMDLIREAVDQGAESVIMPMESAETHYMWCLRPVSEERADYFRQFYGLPEDLKLIYLPLGTFDDWPYIDPDMLAIAAVF